MGSLGETIIRIINYKTKQAKLAYKTLSMDLIILKTSASSVMKYHILFTFLND